MFRKDDTLGIEWASSTFTSGGRTDEERPERRPRNSLDIFAGFGAGRRRGEAVGEGTGEGFTLREGGGGGGFLLNRKSEEEFEGRKVGLSGMRSPLAGEPEVAR